MEEKTKPFDGSVSRHYPIEGMENPSTQIEHVAGGQAKNIENIADENGEGTLPKIEVKKIKPN